MKAIIVPGEVASSLAIRESTALSVGFGAALASGQSSPIFARVLLFDDVRADVQIHTVERARLGKIV